MARGGELKAELDAHRRHAAWPQPKLLLDRFLDDADAHRARLAHLADYNAIFASKRGARAADAGRRLWPRHLELPPSVLRVQRERAGRRAAASANFSDDPLLRPQSLRQERRNELAKGCEQRRREMRAGRRRSFAFRFNAFSTRISIQWKKCRVRRTPAARSRQTRRSTTMSIFTASR